MRKIPGCADVQGSGLAVQGWNCKNRRRTPPAVGNPPPFDYDEATAGAGDEYRGPAPRAFYRSDGSSVKARRRSAWAFS
jgi:hypothetical protein